MKGNAVISHTMLGYEDHHAMKRWIPRATDEEVRSEVDKLMDLSSEIAVKYSNISYCQHCQCMTHTINGKCGKCGGLK